MDRKNKKNVAVTAGLAAVLALSPVTGPVVTALAVEPGITMGDQVVETYTVTYEYCGGTDKDGVTGPKTVEYKPNNKLNVNGSNPQGMKREGYAFGGWYTDPEYSKDSKVNVMSYMVNSNLTLYAKWNENPTLTFYNEISYDDMNGVDPWRQVEHTYDDSYGKPTPEIPEGYNTDDYVFDNWYTDPSCTEEYKVESKDWNSGFTEDTTFYAKWTKKPVVEFYLSGESKEPIFSTKVNPGGSVTTGAAKDRFPAEAANYELDGWYADPSYSEGSKYNSYQWGQKGGITEDTKLYAKFKTSPAVTFDFQFDNNQSQKVSINFGDYVDAADVPSYDREGYVVTGWYTDPECTEAYALGAEPVLGDLKLYAKWEEASAETVTITFDDGIEGNSGTTVTVKNGERVTQPDDPTREGFEFDGWYVDPDFKQLYDFDSVVTKDMTLYAKWVEKTQEEPERHLVAIYINGVNYGNWNMPADAETVTGFAESDVPEGQEFAGTWTVTWKDGTSTTGKALDELSGEWDSVVRITAEFKDVSEQPEDHGHGWYHGWHSGNWVVGDWAAWHPIIDIDGNGYCDLCWARYECGEKPQDPELGVPTDEQLIAMLGDNAVKVECITEGADHEAKTYELLGGTYAVTYDMDEDGDAGTATVSVTGPSLYMDAYNAVYGTHTEAEGQATTQTITFEFELQPEGVWKIVDGYNPVIFQVECEPAAEPEQPGAPTTDEIVALLEDDAVRVKCVTEGPGHPDELYALKGGTFAVAYDMADDGQTCAATVTVDGPGLYMDAYNAEHGEHAAVAGQATTQTIELSLARMADGDWALSGGYLPASFEVECELPDNPDNPGTNPGNPGGGTTDPDNPGTEDPVAKTHKVTFDDCLPSTENQVVEVKDGEPVAKPADPTCEGWKFEGWYSDTDLTQAWDFSTPVTEDMTLWAKWSQVEEPGTDEPGTDTPGTDEPGTTPEQPGDSTQTPGSGDQSIGGTNESAIPNTGDATVAVSGIAGLGAALAGIGAFIRRRR